jgi:hypothetical protein
MGKSTYYSDQLKQIDTKNEYAPKIQIHNGENDTKTHFLDINKESAAELVKWLSDNFLK